MLLKRLKADDFLIFKSIDIDLSTHSLSAIIGQFAADKKRSNGSGKSAFIEAIRYGLFNQTRSKSKDGIIRSGSSECSVEIEFTVRSKHYHVIRKRKLSGVAESSLLIDGRQAGNKVAVVNAAIEQALGVDAELFDLIYFFRQRDHFTFVESGPTERKAVLSRLFRMSQIDKCHELAKQKRQAIFIAEQKLLGSIQARNTSIDRVDFVALKSKEEELIDLEQSLHTSSESIHLFLHDYTEEVAYAKDMIDSLKGECQTAIAEKNSLTAHLGRQMAALTNAEKLRDTAKQQIAAEINWPVPINPNFDIEKLNADKRKLEDEVVAIGHEIKVLNLERSRWDELLKISMLTGASCPTCKQVLDVAIGKKFADDANVGIAKIHGMVIQHAATIKQCQDKIKQIESDLNKQSVYQKSLDARKSIEDDHNRKIINLQNLQRDVDRCKDEVTTTLVALPKFTDATKVLEEMIADTTKTVSYINSIEDTALKFKANAVFNLKLNEQELINVRKQIEDYNRLVNENESSKAKLLEISRDIEIYDKLMHIFSKNGMPAIMIENTIGVIQEHINDILNKMHTRFTVRLRTQKENKDGEQKETLDIVVVDGSSERLFEEFSGGEQTLINLSIRLAFSRIISCLHGVEIRCLFMDEVFGALDEGNRQEAIKMIAFLAKSYDQVFIISHTDEVKDIIDSSITIVRNNDYSDVIVTNAA